MARDYYKQAKFATHRYSGQASEQGEATAAYLASKDVETFAKAKRTGKPTRNRLIPGPLQETFCQCWKCLSVMTMDTDCTTQELRCKYCRGPVEVLTVDGVPFLG